MEAVTAAGLDGLLVTPGPDLRYLTGYDAMPLERLTLLRLASGAEPVIFVPRLERAAAEAADGMDGVLLEDWSDGQDPYTAAARLLGVGRYALTDRTWATHVLALQAVAPGAGLVAAGDAVPLLRAVKDDHELDRLATAGAAADAAFAEIVGARFAGRTEREIAGYLAELLRSHRHERVDFTIVGSGPNGASPHHGASDRRIVPGDAIVMDFGGFVDGYGSDITRTVVVESAPDGFDDVYAAVRAAQQACFEAIEPRRPCEDIDRVARDVIELAGFGDLFIHRTGHGIGLETHEQPYIVSGNLTPLEPGMTFSIEPGIYLEGRFGVRIEDIVAVTPSGGRRFNEASRDLTVVD